MEFAHRLNILCRHTIFLCLLSLSAGEFIPRDLKSLSQDEQYMQDNGIGDIDVIASFNNKEGALVLFMMHFAQLPPESLYSPQFFGSMVDACLMLNQGHGNTVLWKVSFSLFVCFISVSLFCCSHPLSIFSCVSCNNYV